MFFNCCICANHCDNPDNCKNIGVCCKESVGRDYEITRKVRLCPLRKRLVAKIACNKNTYEGQMKKYCSYKHCGERRSHFTQQDTNRMQQVVEVDDDHEGDVYCSLTCSMMDGKMKARVKDEESN